MTATDTATERDHILGADCWCEPTRTRWDEQTQQWVTVQS